MAKRNHVEFFSKLNVLPSETRVAPGPASLSGKLSQYPECGSETLSSAARYPWVKFQSNIKSSIFCVKTLKASKKKFFMFSLKTLKVCWKILCFLCWEHWNPVDVNVIFAGISWQTLWGCPSVPGWGWMPQMTKILRGKLLVNLLRTELNILPKEFEVTL